MVSRILLFSLLYYNIGYGHGEVMENLLELAERYKANAIAAANNKELDLESPIDSCKMEKMHYKYGFTFQQSTDQFGQVEDGKIVITQPKARKVTYLLEFFKGASANPKAKLEHPLKNIAPDWPAPNFPGCGVPSCVASKLAWSSPGIENLKNETFRMVLAHKDVSRIWSNILGLENMPGDKMDLDCPLMSYNFGLLVMKLHAKGRTSNEMRCLQPTSGIFALDCVSQQGVGLSNQVIRSDKSTWVLLNQCWSSGEKTWSLYVRDESNYEVTTDAKWKALRTITALGFSPCEYEEFEHKNCPK